MLFVSLLELEPPSSIPLLIKPNGIFFVTSQKFKQKFELDPKRMKYF